MPGPSDQPVPHRALLALSYAPRLDPAARAELDRRARRALALLCDAAPRACVAEEDLLVLVAGDVAPHHVAADGALVQSFGVGGTDWRRERPCEAPRLLVALRAAGAAALADFTPPFAALFRTRRTAPLEAATDACGLFHVYVAAGPGFAACGSSCLALGALQDGGLDLDSLAGYARLGLYLGARTPLSGVRRLQPREVCALAAGTVRVAAWAEAPRREPALRSFAEAVDAGAGAVRAAVGSLAAAHARIGISLSGGLDSRLVLAALPPERRAALEVLCIDAPGSEDGALVGRLAAHCGFAPTVVDTRRFPHGRAAALARGAARLRDYCANPLSTAVLEWVESALPPTPRLHGQNGEFARGHYHAHQPAEGGVTSDRVAALVQSRRFTGRSVAPQVLAAAYREPVAAALRDEIHAWLAATGLPWLDALDELYLGQRMAGWVGTELSRTSMRRVDLSPFFDPRFLAFARRAAACNKRDSRLLAAVLEAIDPALAALPLEGRPPAAALWRAAPPRPLATASALATQAPRQSRAGAAVPAGADLVRAELLDGAEAAGLSLARAAACPLFDADALAGALQRDSPLDVVTLGFALDVEWMLAFLEDVRAGADLRGQRRATPPGDTAPPPARR
jgi:asparagine synthase (glutamine-hydrolysing)